MHFFHGLESLHISDKSDYLHDNFLGRAYCPKMDYRDKGTYEYILKLIKAYDFDLLIGSSVGGWFAYCISLEAGIDTVLFNPAFNRMEFTNHLGIKTANHTVILGKNDDIVNQIQSKKYIKDYGICKFEIYEENIEHRIPIEIFEKYIKKYI